MSDRLRPKYMVFRIDEETGAIAAEGGMKSTDPGDVDSPFVLKVRRDPAAFVAMVAYTNYCEPQLAGEIRAWLRRVAEATPVFGSQGELNYRYVRSRSLEDNLE